MEEFGNDFSTRLESSRRRSAGKMPPSSRPKSVSRASRRKTLDPSMLPGNRGQPVPQVSEVGCGCKTWNKIGLGIDLGTTSAAASTSESTRKSGDKTPVTSSTAICNRKLPKSVSDIFFRRVKSATPPASSSPKFEEQWSSFREQHQQEMNEMKQMYSALQSMCHEIKTITGQRAGVSPSGESTPPVRHNPPQKATIGRPKAAVSEKKPPLEKPQLVVTPRRARSAPRTRAGTHHLHPDLHPPARDLSGSVNLFFRSPWTDITTSLFEEIVQVQKTFLRSFCQSIAKHREASLVADAANDREAAPAGNPPPTATDVVSALVARLLPHTSFAKPWHLKYAVEAWINRVVLGDFGTESYGLDEPTQGYTPPATATATATEGRTPATAMAMEGRAPATSVSLSLSPWEEYERLALLSPSDAINPERSKAGVYHERFHRFCNRKFQAIHKELQGWWEEWPATLVEEFLEAMKHVWRAHKLAHAFDVPAAIFCVKTSTAFDPKYMETVLDVAQFDSSSTFSTKVGFMVTPGFLVQGQVIKSQVYLMPKIGRLLCSPFQATPNFGA